jgi:hypothetical protein
MRKKLFTFAMVVVALAGACSSGGGSGDSAQTAATDTTAAPEQTSTSVVDTTAAPQSQSESRGRRTIQYPAGGPAGPVFPPGTPAYDRLSRGQCGNLLDEINRGWLDPANPVDRKLLLLYRSAAQACLSRWDAAVRDFEELRRLGPSFGAACAQSQGETCERCHQIVLAWVTMVIEAFRSNPQSPPRFVRSSARSPCPPETTTTTSGSTDSPSGSQTTVRR